MAKAKGQATRQKRGRVEEEEEEESSSDDSVVEVQPPTKRARR